MEHVFDFKYSDISVKNILDLIKAGTLEFDDFTQLRQLSTYEKSIDNCSPIVFKAFEQSIKSLHDSQKLLSFNVHGGMSKSKFDELEDDDKNIVLLLTVKNLNYNETSTILSSKLETAKNQIVETLVENPSDVVKEQKEIIRAPKLSKSKSRKPSEVPSVSNVTSISSRKQSSLTISDLPESKTRDTKRKIRNSVSKPLGAKNKSKTRDTKDGNVIRNPKLTV